MAFPIHNRASDLWKHRVIFPMLFLALLIGLIYAFVVPPWQHYDEPTHFEFAWLIANRGSLPEIGEFDQILRREIAASMLEYDFFEKMEIRPILIAQGEPVWIGASQINQRSLYYLMIAAPLYLIRGTDVVFQLYVGRFVSIGLFLMSILAAYGVVSEVTRPGNPLRWFVPTTIAFIPGFVDLMTAVNDDVGATALFSLFLWAGIRTILRGLNWLRLLGVAGLAAACYWTKNTVTIAVILAFIPILFGIFTGQKRWYAWLILAGVGILMGASALGWGDAASWYRVRYPEGPIRTDGTGTPFGNYAFHFPVTEGLSPPSVTQVLTGPQVDQLSGKTVTLGAWIWASKPLIVRTPILYYDTKSNYLLIDVNEEPYYYNFTTTIPENPTRLQVILSPIRGLPEESASVYYDGLVLIEGELLGEPSFDGSRGNQLLIEQKPVVNLLRNASAEATWPYVQVWADEFINEFFPGRSSLILAASIDWSPSLWYYKAAFRQLFTSFWARFGWGHITLSGFHPYTILGIFTAIGLVSGIIGLGKRGHTLPWDVVIFFGASIVAVWGAALMRGIGSILTGPIFIPSARYAYPVIIPSMFLLSIGWNELIRYGSRFAALSFKRLYVLYFLFFLGLTLLSLFTIFQFYYR